LTDYQIAFHHATPHGLLTAIHIPDCRDPVPDSAVLRLHRREQEIARCLNGYRQVQFVGGRLAMRHAMSQLSIPEAPVLTNDRGAPMLPKGFTGSVSHKRTLAVAMVARSAQGTLGVDIEDYGPSRLGIAPRVLTSAELRSIESLPDPRRWTATLLRFSLKEAIYKALDPYVRRYVGFHEVEVWPDVNGGVRTELMLDPSHGPFDVQCRFEWLHQRLLTSARVVRCATGCSPG